MKIDILPLHEAYRNCFEDSLISVAVWGRCDFELMFSEAWGFKFNEEMFDITGMLGKSISSDGEDPWRLLEKYHGVKLNCWQESDLYKSISEIHNEVKGEMPILLTTNVNEFLCTWDSESQQHHYVHVFLIVGMDQETLYGIDAYVKKNHLSIPLESLRNQEGTIIKFQFIDMGYAPDSAYILTQAANRLLHGGGASSFDMMRSFAQTLKKVEDLTNDLGGFHEVWRPPYLIAELCKLSNGRKQFITSLRYLERRWNIDGISNISNYLTASAEEWSTIMSIITKAYCKSNDRILLERAIRRIEKVADLEEKAASELLRLRQ